MIKKAIIPVAGFGTRVMPLTLHQPKGMISIVDRPIIHYVIDEALSAGIKEFVLVIGPKQTAFKKYITYLLEKDPNWKDLKFSFVMQKKMAGNGDAVYRAKSKTKKEPFALCFGDDIDAPSPIDDLIKVYKKVKAPIILLEQVPRHLVSRYGVVSFKPTAFGEETVEITGVVEKPKPEEAPSDLTIIGRYILTPEILQMIKLVIPETPAGKEVYLTEAFNKYLRSGGKIYGLKYAGQRFDCGSKIGILKAQAYFGLHHPDFKDELEKYLKKLRG